MQSDGSARTELPWLLPGDGDPAVSPDGRRLAFSSARNGNREIYVADATTGERAAPDGQSQARRPKPAWSPDGRRIAWQAGAPGRPADVFVMRADGGEEAPPRGRAERRHRPGVVTRRDAHRVRLESQRRLRPLGGAEQRAASRSCCSTPPAPPGRRRGARTARSSPTAGRAAVPRASGSCASARSRRAASPRSPARGPAPGLVARREPPGLHPRRSRPLAHLGHPGCEAAPPGPSTAREGDIDPDWAIAAPALAPGPRAAPARPRPACAGRPRRDRQGGRVLPRIHLRGGQPRSGPAPDPRLAAAPGRPACAPTR